MEKKTIEYQEKNYKQVECNERPESGSLKSVIVGYAEQMCGTRRAGDGVRKGSEWYCKVTMTVGKKKLAYGIWLQK